MLSSCKSPKTEKTIGVIGTKVKNHSWRLRQNSSCRFILNREPDRAFALIAMTILITNFKIQLSYESPNLTPYTLHRLHHTPYTLSATTLKSNSLNPKS